jgi:hypothetical protein
MQRIRSTDRDGSEDMIFCEPLYDHRSHNIPDAETVLKSLSADPPEINAKELFSKAGNSWVPATKSFSHQCYERSAYFYKD